MKFNCLLATLVLALCAAGQAQPLVKSEPLPKAKPPPESMSSMVPLEVETLCTVHTMDTTMILFSSGASEEDVKQSLMHFQIWLRRLLRGPLKDDERARDRLRLNMAGQRDRTPEETRKKERAWCAISAEILYDAGSKSDQKAALEFADRNYPKLRLLSAEKALGLR